MTLSVNTHRVTAVYGNDYLETYPWATMTLSDRDGNEVTVYFHPEESDIARDIIARCVAILKVIDPAPEPEPQDEPTDYWMYADAYEE